MSILKKILKENDSTDFEFKILKNKPEDDMTTINAYLDKKKVGYIIIGYYDGMHDVPYYADIMYAEIVKKYRGKGYFKILLNKAIEQSQKIKTANGKFLKGVYARNVDQTEDAKRAIKNIKNKESDNIKYFTKK